MIYFAIFVLLIIRIIIILFLINFQYLYLSIIAFFSYFLITNTKSK